MQYSLISAPPLAVCVAVCRRTCFRACWSPPLLLLARLLPRVFLILNPLPVPPVPGRLFQLTTTKSGMPDYTRRSSDTQYIVSTARMNA
jgi:hypothetical protein